MMSELRKLRELTEALTGNGYLKDQAEEWEYALDSIPDCIYIIDKKFHVKFMNMALITRLGITKEEGCDEVCYEFIRGLSLEDLSEGWRDSTGTVVVEEDYIEKLGGWFSLTRSPIFTKSGKLLGFICVLQDKTIEKESVRKMELREKAFKSIFNSAPVGMALVEKTSYTFWSANASLVKLIQYSEEELIGKSIRVLCDTEENFITFKESLASSVFKDIRIVNKQGETVYVCFKAVDMEESFLLVFKESIDEDICSGG